MTQPDPIAAALDAAAARSAQAAQLEARQAAAANAPGIEELIARAESYAHPTQRAAETEPDQAWIEAELVKIRDPLSGFGYWMEHYVWIEDKESGQRVRFEPWPAQLAIAHELLQGRWLVLLKARRLGFTTLIEAYVCWKTIFHRMKRAVVTCQEKPYAAEFISRCKSLIANLPAWQRPTFTRDGTYLVKFGAHQHGGAILAFASTKRAARSLDADIVVFDEAAYQRYLALAMNATIPAAEQGGGQLIVLSTSDGPKGKFYDLFTKEWESELGLLKEDLIQALKDAVKRPRRWKAMFFPFDARPGRDAAWYDRMKADFDDDPLMMKREYPRTPDEAWESAEGRIYPLFARDERFLQRFKIEPEWPHYRGIDWGGTDPFVCLWAVQIPGAAAGLTVDPGCKELIREMIAYAWGDNDQPQDADNHGPDALRYLIVTPGKDGLRGHVHVYRELYVAHSAAKGLSPADLAARVKLLSGNERYRLSVADRSRPDSITLFTQLGVPVRPHRTLKGPHGGEVQQGIGRVNLLVKASADGDNAELLPAARSTPQTPKRFTLEGNRDAALSFRGLPGRRFGPVFG